MRLIVIFIGVITLLLVSYLPRFSTKNQTCLQLGIFIALLFVINVKFESCLIEVFPLETFSIESVQYEAEKATQLTYLDTENELKTLELDSHPYTKDSQLEEGSVLQHTFADQFSLTLFNRIRIPLKQSAAYQAHTIQLPTEAH